MMEKKRQQVDEQTLKDLEFNTIREWLAAYAKGPTAEKRLAELSPSVQSEFILHQLHTVNEYLQIREVGDNLPAIDFEELEKEIKLLPIKNAILIQEGFIRILTACELTNRLLHFFDKREEDYPNLFRLLKEAEYNIEIPALIEKVFDRRGQIKDKASEYLATIRNEIKGVRVKINKNFDRELRKLAKENILGDTREAFVDERRVLTILSTHKRKVEGNVVGSSKSGSMTFVEPAANIELNRELNRLLDDERKEILRILKLLTRDVADFLPLIETYQKVLTEFDFQHAKMKLAMDLNAVMPNINDDQEMELLESYHPILRKTNQDLGKPTFPQTIRINKFARMLVISGPNAGGKSITLKTVGLLQVMLQSGLLVPIHANSKMFFFQHILSDIGDNQSIANELSTYSYRLKRMRHFLDVTNKKTLLLLDEFGTGSDPDLGGALAEVFFEELYNKKAFGVITTHYSNIKLKADQLRNAVNGCMLFDVDTLAPLFTFAIGQPGSSFTFEVAQINGIPQNIIDEAKSRISEQKINMDKLLSDLQKEKTYLERLRGEHIEAQALAQKAQHSFEDKKAWYEEKLRIQQQTTETNNRYLHVGKKMAGFIDKFNVKSKKKTVNTPLVEEFVKYLKVEKSKIEDGIVKEKATFPKVVQKKKKIKPEQDTHQRHRIVVGSQVKLIENRKSGTVEKIEGDNITVLFGFIRMKVDREKLTWIQ